MELREFICKCCTAPLDISEAVGRTVRCKHCGTVFILARENDGKIVDLLRSAELLLNICKFDEAYTAYQKVADLDSKEPEAYFGMALATFKVQYLKDEVNNRLQPICHEISENVFSDDKNFRKALELAADEQKREYRKRGREIDEIKEEFYELQRKGLDYDCFLCVKVTEEDGRTKTEDYDRANDIYYHLKDKGYMPFFSEREMKERTGSDYEALILYALYMSECMLIVCSNEEYLQTKWVKNEYTRFLHMLANEEKERDAVTFVFKGKPVEKLPSNGKKVQGIDFSKPDAYMRIDEFVQKHTPEARHRKEEEEARKRAEEEARNKELDELRQNIAQIKREFAVASASSGDHASVRSSNDPVTEQAEEDVQGKREYDPNNREDDEWKRREEEAILAAKRLAREEEERTRREEAEEDKRLQEEEHIAYLAQFYIEDGELKSYRRNCDRYKEEKYDLVIPDNVISIGHRVFEGNKALTSVTIPKSVTSIGTSAFEGCSGITSITIPNSVTSIGGSAFEGCSGITSIMIPNSVTKIGGSAFRGCNGLTSIIIPDGVNSIDDGTFEGCSGLTSITIPNSVTLISRSAFLGCSGILNIKVAESNKIYRGEGNCIIVKETNELILGCKNSVIPSGVKYIGDSAFYGCSGLKNIFIPDSVKQVGDSAFEGCSGLTSITIPNNVDKIGKSTFEGCSGLTSIIISNSVTSIGDSAFEGCSGLTSIIIPNSVTSIGERAFYGCIGLTGITISENWDYIGDSAFEGCSELTSIAIPNKAYWFWESIGERAFACEKLSFVTIPKHFKGFMNIKLKKIFGYRYKSIAFEFI